MAAPPRQLLQAPPHRKEKIAVLPRAKENPRTSTRAMARMLCAGATPQAVAKLLIQRGKLRPRLAFAVANLVTGLHNALSQHGLHRLPTSDRLLRLPLKAWQCMPRKLWYCSKMNMVKNALTLRCWILVPQLSSAAMDRSSATWTT